MEDFRFWRSLDTSRMPDPIQWPRLRVVLHKESFMMSENRATIEETGELTTISNLRALTLGVLVLRMTVELLREEYTSQA